MYINFLHFAWLYINLIPRFSVLQSHSERLGYVCCVANDTEVLPCLNNTKQITQTWEKHGSDWINNQAVLTCYLKTTRLPRISHLHLLTCKNCLHTFVKFLHLHNQFQYWTSAALCMFLRTCWCESKSFIKHLLITASSSHRGFGQNLLLIIRICF